MVSVRPVIGVDRLRVVVLRPRLLFLAAAVMVDRERGDPGGAGRVREQERGAAAVRAHLRQGQPEPPGLDRGIQREPLAQRLTTMVTMTKNLRMSMSTWFLAYERVLRSVSHMHALPGRDVRRHRTPYKQPSRAAQRKES
jgi:hypothetical protein